jgi:hypothetical protein
VNCDSGQRKVAGSCKIEILWNGNEIMVT